MLYIYSKSVFAMVPKNIKTQLFDTQESLKRATHLKQQEKKWTLAAEDRIYKWSNAMERVSVIRKGVAYDVIETVSKRLNKPVKSMLSIVGMPQTTYNKRKNERALLDRRDSELMVLITELLDYGIEVFNNEEEKFQRWLKKSNQSLGGNTPESMLDTVTGIDEVGYCLNRIEYGNFA